MEACKSPYLETGGSDEVSFDDLKSFPDRVQVVLAGSGVHPWIPC